MCNLSDLDWQVNIAWCLYLCVYTRVSCMKLGNVKVGINMIEMFYVIFISEIATNEVKSLCDLYHDFLCHHNILVDIEK